MTQITVVSMTKTPDTSFLEIGQSYYFGVAHEAKVHEGRLLSIHLNDSIEPCASFNDMSNGGRYVVIPTRLISGTRKAAQELWNEERKLKKPKS